MDKSDIEILREFAKSTNRSIEVKELLYPRTGISTTQKYKRMVYIPNNPEKTSFFIWFNDPYLKVGQTTIFSGAFIPLSSKVKTRISIRNRYILDKLNIFKQSKNNKIGNINFDSSVVISGNPDAATKRILSSSKVQKQILKALEIESYFHISINQLNIDFVPELSEKSSISVINHQGWEVDKTNIEKMFESIEKIRAIIE
ncbi:MAG: hypothetical protein KQH67_10820 [Bacteroidetes bacterium]|nr:hypothetical protein [Bacteroidota bacterium]